MPSAFIALYSLAMFLGAGLLFWAEPLVAKMLLPSLGGSPAVWSASMAFYQGCLLLGYLYAHLLSTRTPARLQATLHLILLAAAAFALPLDPPSGGPPADAEPALWLLGALTWTIGAPFVVVSATAPLLQRWYAASGQPGAEDPYFLYAASNLGSFAALLAFPFLLEPSLPLHGQTTLWGATYSGLILATLACAAVVWNSAKRSTGSAALSLSGRVQPPSPAGPAESSSRPLPDQAAAPIAEAAMPAGRLTWIALAFVPSSLLLGVTQHVTTDIAAAPLLWIVPLALYLLSFVNAFAKRPPISTWLALSAQIVLLPLVACWDLWRLETRSLFAMGAHLALFMATALACHGLLAERRPRTDRLSEYYLCLAFGGALGGLFNSLAAPLLFSSVLEYPLILAAACLLRPGRAPGRDKPVAALLDVVLPALLALALIRPWPVVGALAPAVVPWEGMALAGAAALALPFWARRPLRLGLAACALLVVGPLLQKDESLIHQSRDFFGVLRVRQDQGESIDSGMRTLLHGTTAHGVQSLAPGRRFQPMSYYHPTGPVGQLFDRIDRQRVRRTAAVGLGAGTLAAYILPGDDWTFFEIDPGVVRVAADPSLFTFLAHASAPPRVVLGDARLSLAREPRQSYGLIILDAFSSDAIPMHLLTLEAVRLYVDRLAPGGLLFVHISNRFLDLAPELGRIAASLGLTGLWEKDGDETPLGPGDWKASTDWVLLARSGEDLAFLSGDARWKPLPMPEGGPWTDDYSDVLRAMRWKSASLFQDE